LKGSKLHMDLATIVQITSIQQTVLKIPKITVVKKGPHPKETLRESSMQVPATTDEQ